MVIAMTQLNWKHPDTNFTTEYLVIDTLNLVATLANLGLRYAAAQVFLSKIFFGRGLMYS